METLPQDNKTTINAELNNERTYSGESAFLCSTKFNNEVNLESVCETLVSSDLFPLALDSTGKIYYKNNGHLKKIILDTDLDISGLGMRANGHADFLSSNPETSHTHSFIIALNLLLSDKKLLSPDFGFPPKSARIFMRPIALKHQNSTEHEIVIPYLRVYEGGMISVVLSPILGFEDHTLSEVVLFEVNRARREITSLLCEKAIHKAFMECELSQLSMKARALQRNHYETLISTSFNNPTEVDFLGEKITTYELIHNNKFTISDFSRNLLTLVAKPVAAGSVRTKVSWISRKYVNNSIGDYWNAKPIIFISSHTDQRFSAKDNWDAHSNLVKSILARAHSAHLSNKALSEPKDLRMFDDYNNFYSESASLMLPAAKATTPPSDEDSYTFQNLKFDVLVLNEAAHIMTIHEMYAVIKLNKCASSLEISNLEIEKLKFEESQLSSFQHGEIFNFFEEVRLGDQLKFIGILFKKKLEIKRKAIELSEKKSSESNTQRTTMAFGLIASATLSPELFQPLAKYFGFNYSDDINKLLGISLSIAAVIIILVTTKAVVKLWRSLFS